MLFDLQLIYFLVSKKQKTNKYWNGINNERLGENYMTNDDIHALK